MKQFFILLFILPFFGYGQNLKLTKANDKFSRLAYAEAIDLYEHYLSKGGDSSLAASNIATSYSKINNVQKAHQWYEFMYTKNYLSANQYIEFALLKRQLKEHDKSIVVLKQFETKFGPNDISKNLLEQNQTLIEQLELSNNFIIKKEKMNTEASEIGVSFITDKTILITSAKRFNNLSDKRYSWNNTNFYSVCLAELNNLSEIHTYNPLKGEINTKYHDGPACVDTVNKYIYFTRDSYLDGKLGQDESKTTRLKIYRGKYTNNEVSAIEELHFNSDNFSTGHPTLNANGTRLYFVSDRPGGLGGTDLYYADIDAQGIVGNPVNMGDKINTSLNEMFPYYHSTDNILFFASNGLPGFGGLDVFVAKLNEDQSVSRITNMGTGINSSMDDFSFITNSTQTNGFFCSNRDLKVGDDDVFSFRQLKKIQNSPRITGYILDEITGLPIPYSPVYLIVENDTLNQVLANNEGFFDMPLDSINTNFYVASNPEGYLPKKKEVPFEEGKLDYKEDILFGKDAYHRLIGVVKDRDTKKPIEDVSIAVTGINKTTYSSDFTTNSEGKFKSEKITNLIPDNQFTVELKVSKSGYLTEKYVFSHKVTSDSIIDVTAFLNLQMTRIEIGKTDLAKVVQINPIYFDFDKYNIRPDAALELDKIVRVMLDNPEIKIELGSHTDTRGSDEYNLWLSDMRAKSSAEYIISNGISNNRIYGKGYGETKLVVTDTEINKKGTKAERERLHQLNRRTEFIIVSVGNTDGKVVENNRITSKTTIAQEVTYNDSGDVQIIDYYIVKPNETLYRVYINTGISVDRLKELNSLKSDNLKAGQKLRLN